MDWTFWTLSGLAVIGVTAIGLLVYDYFFDAGGWDDHADDWMDE